MGKFIMVTVWVAAIAVALVAAAATTAWFVARKADIPYQDLERLYADASSRFVDLPGGVHMHYRDLGEPHAPVIVLVHGLGGSSLSWSGWSEVLGSSFRILEIDLPGHGLTRAPADWEPSIEAYSDSLRAFTQEMNLDQFTLVGASLGGFVAWTYAARKPKSIAALVLADAAGWPPDKEHKAPAALRFLRFPLVLDAVSQIDVTSRFRSALRSAYADPNKVDDAMVRRYAALARAPGHRRIIFATTAGVDSYTPATKERLAAIQVPTLILHGAHDNRIPVSDAERFRDAISDAELIVYPEAGHALAVEFADRAASDVRGFLKRRAPVIESQGASD